MEDKRKDKILVNWEGEGLDEISPEAIKEGDIILLLPLEPHSEPKEKK